jgi:hypothetical protein
MSNRRSFLGNLGGGFGSVALAAMLADEAAADDPLAPKKTHHDAAARRVIFLFMSGGPSHLDTFDPKPELTRLHGAKLPASFGPVKTRRAVDKNKLLASKRTFTKHGQSGIEISDWFPHLARQIDDICLLRGCRGDSVTHPESVYLMNTGSILMGRPSLGAWAAYGLGTDNRNMPAFVVLPDPGGWPKGGAPAWGNGFLPATYQGTVIQGGAAPIRHLPNPAGVSTEQQRRTLDFVAQGNAEQLAARGADSALSARIAAYELAFRMQSHAPEVVDLTKETEETKRLYGLDRKETAEFGTRCLLARRMAERGVRFIQVYCGDTNGWDAHSDLDANHGRLCLQSDKPIAGLLADLKRR